ncbi:MAG TPA: hypothetical protein EYP32_00085, partial [Aquificaceae bacterium]|nr:hypothetical protein [Aquificaceae bacterium]
MKKYYIAFCFGIIPENFSKTFKYKDKEQNEQVARDAKIVQEVRKELLVEFDKEVEKIYKKLEKYLKDASFFDMVKSGTK